MKKSTLRIGIALTSFVFLLWLGISGCQKEKLAESHTATDKEIVLRTSESGAQLVLSHAAETDSPGSLQERDNNWDGQKKPVFPYGDGPCRFIFKIYAFNPTMIHGGFEPPCYNSYITIKGYSAPNGQGILLFSQTLLITGAWQVIQIPNSCYMMFQITRPHGGDCSYKFTTADYGWNKAVFEWWGITPGSAWLPIYMGRFAPKDLSAGGNYYDEYLCESWCTWSVPVSYTTIDPWPTPWTTTRMVCFYGPAQNYVSYSDPRVIKDIFVYEKKDQTLLYYPIVYPSNQLYTSKAQDLANHSDVDFINYYVLGDNGQGLGPFGWGNSDALVTSHGCNIQQ